MLELCVRIPSRIAFLSRVAGVNGCIVRGGVNGITFGAVVVNNTGERVAGAGPGWLLRARLLAVGSWGAAIVFHVLFSFWLRCVDFRTECVLIILIIPHFCAFVKLKCDIFDF